MNSDGNKILDAIKRMAADDNKGLRMTTTIVDVKDDQRGYIDQMKHLQILLLVSSNSSLVKIVYDELDGENRHLISILVEENHYLNDDSIKDTVNVYTLQDILERLPPIIDEVYWLTLEVMDRR